MKRKTTLTALVAVLGLALAGAIPALAQDEEPAASPSAATCPYHDQTPMTSQDMDRWMESTAHDEWMSSTDHDQMHAWMSEREQMMDEWGVGPGNRWEG